MKSRINLIAVIILMVSLLSNVSAQDMNDKSNIAKLQQAQISYNMNDMVTVEYLDIFAEGRRKMKVRVYEESGKLVFSQSLNKKGDVKIGYDISQFPTGNYTFELSKNREPVCSKVITKQESIANDESNIKLNIAKLQQAQIRYNMNDLVTVEYLDVFDEGRRKMEIRVYEESGELVYSKSLDKNGDVKLDYDISQFPAGRYTIELYRNHESVCSKRIVKQESIADVNK